MESTFLIEKFPHFAVDFRWKDQDASRARISSWSGQKPHDHMSNNACSGEQYQDTKVSTLDLGLVLVGLPDGPLSPGGTPRPG